MRRLYYHYNCQGALIFSYSDGSGRYVDRCYLFYSFREALQRFRAEFGLQRRHIKVIKLYEGGSQNG